MTNEPRPVAARMSLWIKICGLTSEEGIAAAIDAGADAIGFVFAPSKRQVTAQRAVQLARVAKVPRIAVPCCSSAKSAGSTSAAVSPNGFANRSAVTGPSASKRLRTSSCATWWRQWAGGSIR